MPDRLPVIWSNDDIQSGKNEQLQRQLDFLDNLGIPGVFFVIPQGRDGPIDQDADLCRTIETARNNGHEFYQHGYVHTPFESGVPETWMLDFAPQQRARFDTDRLAIEKTHTLKKMVEKIEAGQRIWRRAFGEASPGYRPGWGAFCNNLYTALETLGYEWVSSRICTQTSWLWNQQMWDQRPDFREGIPGSPWRIGRLIEYPIAGDYGFRLPDDKDQIRRMADLCLEEFEQFYERGWQFNIVSHWHGLEKNGGTGYAVHANALPRIQQTGKAEFMGMAELHKRTAAQLDAASEREQQALCL